MLYPCLFTPFQSGARRNVLKMEHVPKFSVHDKPAASATQRSRHLLLGWIAPRFANRILICWSDLFVVWQTRLESTRSIYIVRISLWWKTTNADSQWFWLTPLCWQLRWLGLCGVTAATVQSTGINICGKFVDEFRGRQRITLRRTWAAIWGKPSRKDRADHHCPFGRSGGCVRELESGSLALEVGDVHLTSVGALLRHFGQHLPSLLFNFVFLHRVYRKIFRRINNEKK